MGSLVTAVAPAAGPSVGGWLAETFGWRATSPWGSWRAPMWCSRWARADGNAMFTTLQQLSGAVGTSVTAAVVNAAQAGVAADGMAAATLAGTQTALVVLVVAVAVALACAVLETGLAARHG